MEIVVDEYKRCSLVKATGRIDSNTPPQLEQAFNDNLENKMGIVFDMSEVDFLSTRGIWVLLETQKACKRKHGKLALANVPEKLIESLELAGVKHFVEIYDDVTRAVGSY